MKKQKDRLVELLNKKYDHFCDQCGVNKDSHYTDNLADYLLANNVVALPFEIGQTAYVVIRNMPFVPADVYECKVMWYALGKDGLRPTVQVKCDIVIINGANFGVYLEDLFLTKEEAEAKLKEGVQG